MPMQTFVAMMSTAKKLADMEAVSFPQSRFSECPFFIMVLRHYRKDKGCLCSNKQERERMIREWQYKEDDFKNIPLID